MRDARGWKDARLAAEMELNSQQVLSNWKRRGEVPTTGIEACASVGVYLVGPEAMEVESPNAEVVPGRMGRRKEAPIVGQVKGGADGYFEEIPMAVGDSDLWVPNLGEDPNAFGLRVVGDSMSPRYNHGEYLVACPNVPFSTGEYVFVSLVTGQKLVKRMGVESVDAFEFISVNNAYKPMTILKSEIERICVVYGPVAAAHVRHQAP